MPFKEIVVAVLTSFVLAEASPAIAADRQFFAVSTSDAAATAAWYGKALGVKTLHEMKAPDGQAHVVILGSDRLLIEVLQHRDAKALEGPGAKSRYLLHGFFKVGFHVLDLEKEVAHLRAIDAEFMTEVIDDPNLHLKFVLVRDNAGNILQIFGPPLVKPN